MATSKPVKGADHETDNDSASDLDYQDIDQAVKNEDTKDIATIHKLSNSFRDRLTYTISLMNIFITCFLVGYAPNYFYIWYTINAAVLLPYRLYTYRKIRYHYFMFDFCYFNTSLILLYSWLPSSVLGESWRGALFVAIYGFSLGPVIMGIPLWYNSIVPHSIDKMTSMYLHVCPALCVWCFRWHSTVEQGFPLCFAPTEPGPGGCDNVSMSDTVYLYTPLLLYCVWVTGYISVMFVFRENKIRRRKYSTSYNWFQKSKKGIILNVFGAKFRKPMYMVWYFLYTAITMLPLPFFYHMKLLTLFVIFLIMSIASYNGASFYINAFSGGYNSKKGLSGSPPERQRLAQAALQKKAS